MAFLYKQTTIKDLDLLTENKNRGTAGSQSIIRRCGYDGGKRAVLQTL